MDTAQSIFPFASGWNSSFYGPIVIPKKGDRIHITPENYKQYERLIQVYENNTLALNNGKIFINGEQTNFYLVKQDYYWMMGDNRDNSLDSRYFGFVPEDHIIGSPVFTWLSIQGLFEKDPYGHPASFKLRWERMFKVPNTDVPLEEKTNFLPYILIVTIFFSVYDHRRKKKMKKNKNDMKN